MVLSHCSNNLIHRVGFPQNQSSMDQLRTGRHPWRFLHRKANFHVLCHIGATTNVQHGNQIVKILISDWLRVPLLQHQPPSLSYYIWTITYCWRWQCASHKNRKVKTLTVFAFSIMWHQTGKLCNTYSGTCWWMERSNNLTSQKGETSP